MEFLKTRNENYVMWFIPSVFHFTPLPSLRQCRRWWHTIDCHFRMNKCEKYSLASIFSHPLRECSSSFAQFKRDSHAELAHNTAQHHTMLSKSKLLCYKTFSKSFSSSSLELFFSFFSPFSVCTFCRHANFQCRRNWIHFKPMKTNFFLSPFEFGAVLHQFSHSSRRCVFIVPSFLIWKNKN